jgi:DNA primase
MCLKSFGYKLEVIAPDSENTIIKPYIVENLKKKYKKVITLFDNDEAGKKAIQKYKEMYNLDGCTLNNCKDISDAVKQHTAQTINTSLRNLLIQTLKQ